MLDMNMRLALDGGAVSFFRRCWRGVEGGGHIPLRTVAHGQDELSAD